MPAAYRLRLFVLLLFICLLQITFTPFLCFGGMRLDLFCSLLAALAVYLPSKETVYLGAFFGAVKDLFTVHFFGINFVVFGIIALFFPILVKRIDSNNLFIRYFLFFIFAFVSFSLYVTVLSLTMNDLYVFFVYIRYCFFSSIYTAFFSLLMVNVLPLLLPKKNAQFELF